MKRLWFLWVAVSFVCLSIAEASSFSRPLLPNTITLSTGESCGTDEYTAGILAKNPELVQKRDRMEARLLQYRQTHPFTSTTGAKTTAEIRTIPVVFHIIHANGTENLSNEVIQQALDTLNATYSNANGNTIDTGFQFALAHTDPQGYCTDGINRIYNVEATTNFGDNYKPLSDWDNTRYYNVWVAAQLYDPSINGYATFPWMESAGSSTDGVAVRSDTLNTTTFTHETGHWLGLYHTFQSACNDANGQITPITSTNCASTGDLICDTAPQAQYWTCPSSTSNTCTNDTPDLADDGTNLMGYTECRDHFTAEQGGRMDAITSDMGTDTDPGAYEIRALLWSSENLETTGVTGVNSQCTATPVADFYSNVTQVTEGTNVAFYDISYRQQNQTVTGWSWTFEGGTPNTSTAQNPIVGYATVGVYPVKLVINNGISQLEKQDYIRVLSEGVDPVSQIFSGNFSKSIFATSTSGRGFGWGSSDDGQLGVGLAGDVQTSPKEVVLPRLLAISSSSEHSLFLTPKGQVYASGSNSYAQLGIEGVESTDTPLLIPTLAGVIISQVLATSKSSYALDDQGRVWAWGANTYYQLGDGTTNTHTVPFLMPGLPTISKISGNSSSFIALDTSGRLWVAGYDLTQLSYTKTPTLITSINAVRDMVVGNNYFILAEKTDHTFWCWGRNDEGQCGLGYASPSSTPYVTTPKEITALRGKTSLQLSAGGSSAYMLDSTQTLWAWGENLYGQLGLANNYQNVLSPTVVSGEVTAVTASYFSVAVIKQGQVCVAGDNSDYEYGNGSQLPEFGSVFDCTVDAALRVKLSPEVYLSAPVQMVDAGMYFSTLLTQDGRLWAWGQNDQGQLGLGLAGSDVNTPQAVTALTGIQAVAAGSGSTQVLRFDGTVWGWGDNSDGELGNGLTTPSLEPVQAIGLENIIALTGKRGAPLALDAAGALWQWGSGSSTPTQVSLSAKMVAIGSGSYFRVALDNGGQVWAWGSNYYGQLGNGTNEDNSTPQGVTGLLTGKRVVEIAVGQQHMLALTDTGEIYAWGDNSYGQLGDGSNEDRNFPVKVSALGTVAHIYAGYQHSLAVTTDDVLYAWGLNNQGQFGNNSIDDSNVPVPVTINSSDTKIMFDGGFAHSLLLKRNSDGRYNLCATGSNYHGQIGNASFEYEYSYTCSTSVLLNDEIQTVDNLAPQVALTAPANNVDFTDGATITLQASASDSDGIARVEFYAEGHLLGMTTVVPYSYAWSNVNVGNYALTAKAIDWRGGVATSTAINVVVKPKASTTLLTNSPSTSTYGTLVTFTALVSGNASYPPTGTVTFKEGSTTLCNAVSLSTTVYPSKAACSYSALSVGSHNITAAYSGDNNNASNTSNTVVQTVNKIITTTALTSSKSTSVYGETVTFTASVSGSTSYPPSGTVTFKVGSTTLCNAVSLSTTAYPSKATCSYSALSAGSHTITAVYNGNSSNASSTSAALTQTVNKKTTSTTLISSASAVTYGSTVTFKATVNGGTSPTGTVTFIDNGQTSLGGCTAITVSNAQASCSYSSFALGRHSITATYNGDNNNVASTSPAVSLTVNAPLAISLTSPVAGMEYPTSIQVNMAASVSGGSAPIKQVDFYVNGTIGTDTTSPYSYKTSKLANGLYTLKATAIDTNGVSKTSNSVTITVCYECY